MRSDVNSWIEQNSQIVKSMWTLYNNPKTKHFIFENSNIKQDKEIINGLQLYSIVVSYRKFTKAED